MQGELKVHELERFKACYCGLCHTLGKKYGFAARFVLNYELLFLAMLLWDPAQTPIFDNKRCIASPFRKKRCCVDSSALDVCAAYTLILTWWKLKDSISDERFIKTIAPRLLCLVLSGPYKKAARDFPGFDAKVREELANLAEYEKQNQPSLDRAADKFAQILTAAAPETVSESVRRTMLELLYHLGRWIYIIDAYDDYKDDMKYGRYNALAARYAPRRDELPESSLSLIESTLIHSNNLIGLAFELLPENNWAEIIRNMIYLGMPYVCRHVVNDDWPPNYK